VKSAPSHVFSWQKSALSGRSGAIFTSVIRYHWNTSKSKSKPIQTFEKRKLIQVQTDPNLWKTKTDPRPVENRTLSENRFFNPYPKEQNPDPWKAKLDWRDVKTLKVIKAEVKTSAFSVALRAEGKKEHEETPDSRLQTPDYISFFISSSGCKLTLPVIR